MTIRLPYASNPLETSAWTTRVTAMMGSGVAAVFVIAPFTRIGMPPFRSFETACYAGALVAALLTAWVVSPALEGARLEADRAPRRWRLRLWMRALIGAWATCIASAWIAIGSDPFVVLIAACCFPIWLPCGLLFAGGLQLLLEVHLRAHRAPGADLAQRVALQCARWSSLLGAGLCAGVFFGTMTGWEPIGVAFVPSLFGSLLGLAVALGEQRAARWLAAVARGDITGIRMLCDEARESGTPLPDLLRDRGDGDEEPSASHLLVELPRDAGGAYRSLARPIARVRHDAALLRLRARVAAEPAMLTLWVLSCWVWPVLAR